MYFMLAYLGGKRPSGGDAPAHDLVQRSGTTRGKLLPYIGGEGESDGGP
jgi:hypothetical protein